MAWTNLPTNYVDATWQGERKYTINLGGGGSYENSTIDDTTSYEQPQSGTYFYGANDANQTNDAINKMVGALGNDINNIIVPISHGGTNATTLAGAKSNLGIATKVVLYNNSSGTSNTIYISEEISGFDCVDIQYMTGSYPTNTARIYEPQSKRATLALVVPGGSGEYTKTSMVLFSGTTISFDSSINTWIEGGSCGVEGATSQIKITKVIGYK